MKESFIIVHTERYCYNCGNTVTSCSECGYKFIDEDNLVCYNDKHKCAMCGASDIVEKEKDEKETLEMAEEYLDDKKIDYVHDEQDREIERNKTRGVSNE